MARVPVFELHIRPMFRLLDQEHMFRFLGKFDLWDLNAVWQNRQDILNKIRLDMPGERYGGPYPDEWISVFERWMQTGTETQPGHHLVLARPEGNYRVQPIGGDKRRLTVNVTAPSPGCRTWFELVSKSETERNYTLCLEPPYPAVPPAPTLMNAVEGFLKAGATRLRIKDAHGEQEVPIP